MKRMLAILLCAAMLLTALPGVAAAAGGALSKNALIEEAKQIYQDCLVLAERESFAGVCGMMTSYQLWRMGINSWLETYDGNKQFDAYSQKETSSGGYHISAYPADTYTLEQALNKISENGTKDVYNILVGFEWTETEAGNIYGHACIINGIIDGTVYFVESFYTSLGGEEGNVIACSISKFANYFADWTVFDGVIYFSRDYADSCQSFGTDMFVRTRFESSLRSLPCLPGENDCKVLRSLGAGELLRTTAVCKNNRDELFYRVEDGEQVGYVAAGAVSVARLNGEDLYLLWQNIPTALSPDKRLTLEGAVMAENASIESVTLTVTNGSGEVVMQVASDVQAESFDLSRLNGRLAMSALSQGAYMLTLTADAALVSAAGGQLTTRYETVELLKSPLVVGDMAVAGLSASADVKIPDGWVWDGNLWYLYDQGQPCTGWKEYLGVRYYLNKDGSVLTGWAEIDDQMRYFSATGAMCTGWLNTEEGTFYLLPDGSAAVGTQTIRGETYEFDDYGILVE